MQPTILSGMIEPLVGSTHPTWKDPPARSGTVSAVGGTEIELPGHRGGESQRGREVVSLFIDSDGVRGRAGEAHQSDLDGIEFLVGFTHPTLGFLSTRRRVGLPFDRCLLSVVQVVDGCVDRFQQAIGGGRVSLPWWR